VISKAGVGSRTEARSWIGSGRVAVNGKIIRTPDHWVDVEKDRVTFDGRPLESKQKRYLLLYKPKGYLTTYKDPEGRLTVYDLLDGVNDFVFPVGRLDQDSSGLLILTNDAQFAEHITNPEHKVAKTYLVKASPALPPDALERLRAGVVLSDGPTQPATVRLERESASNSFVELTLTEGRNRQVRRMVQAVGSKVRKLVRTSIGPLRIGDLDIGKWRDLTPAEVRALWPPIARSRGR
jgi:pseudouridine synthase